MLHCPLDKPRRTRACRPARYAEFAIVRFLPAIIALLVALLGPALGVSAAVQVKSSSPQDGATANAGLTRISITFAQPLTPGKATAQVFDTDGNALPGTQSSVTLSDPALLVVDTQPLLPGSYSVKWSVIGQGDASPTTGILHFVVSDAPLLTPERQQSVPTPASTGPAPTESPTPAAGQEHASGLLFPLLLAGLLIVVVGGLLAFVRARGPRKL